MGVQTDINKICGELKNEVKKVDIDLSSWTTPPDSSKLKSIQVEPDESKTKTVDTPNKPDDSNDVII